MFKKLFTFFALLVLTFLVSINFSKPVLAAPPSGFQSNLVIGSGLEGPSGFEIAPDGRIFILQRTGEIKIYKNGALLPNNFAVLPSVATGDRGLIGIAFDPDFATNHYVYFYYTGLDLLNHLVRFDASGDVGTNGPFILYETTFPSQQLHVGGSIRFGPDGKIYFAVGDNGYPPNAQDLSNPHGKILRINKNGSIPSDNPFFGQPGKLGEIWAYGMRNPWRFQFDSVTGKMYGGDVGDYTIEEVNRIEKGKNYGWPGCEGVCGVSGMTNPIYDYPHAGVGSAITGGPVYRANQFPTAYNGKYFFGDYARGFIKTLTLDANGDSTGVSNFDLNAGSVVDLKVGPDGALYYITYYPGQLYKVTYSTSNQIPVANATSDQTKGVEPFTVNFSSAGSYDPDGTNITYDWDFGDGTHSTLANPQKVYTTKGTYIVYLKVSDGVNIGQSAPIVIQVGTPPTVVIGEPTEGLIYKAGDSIHYTAFATDGAGFDLNDANIKTEIVFHHNTHIHPFLGPITGRQGTFTIPTSNHEAAADTYFEIKVTATDDNGLSTTATRNVFPKKSQLSFLSNIPGLNILLEGVPHATPHVIDGVVGYIRELNAPLIQVYNNIVYQFNSWSDGGLVKHLVTTPDADASFTANFSLSSPFAGEYFNNGNLAGTPSLTRNDNLIDFDWGDHSPNSNINADNFSVRWTKTQHFPVGKFRFKTEVDDGVRLYIDNELIINEWNAQVATFTAEKVLTEGDHQIRMEYMELGGGAVAKLSWEFVDSTTPPPANGYSGQYFNNKDLLGVPVFTRDDQVIDFSWGLGSPNPVVNNDNFSARWTKDITFAEGNYQFKLTGDDGMRLFIDGNKVFDKWIDQAETTYFVTKFLDPGVHTIVFEYYENGGGASAKFSFIPTALPPDPDPTTYGAKFWNLSGTNFNPVIPATAPNVTRADSLINFDWGGGSPDPAVTNDHFVAQWTKTDTFAAGTYQFKTTSDDGIRVYVDDVLVIDEWTDHASTTHTGNKDLTAGEHNIKVEYFENGGGAVAKFEYTKIGDITPPPPSAGFSGKYWNTGTGSSPAIPLTTPDFTRTDAQIDFDWGLGSPDAIINNEHFIAVWESNQEFLDGIYKFNATTDDGVRVYVDGALLIDEWTDHAAITFSEEKTIIAGVHTIKVEYYEVGGGAVAKFDFAKVDAPTPVENPFVGEYFNNLTLTGTPVLVRDDKKVVFTWGNGSPDPLININNFSVRWTKTKNYAAGTYNFTVTADDGVRVKIDGVTVLDKWIDQAPTSYNFSKDLTAGDHTIVIEYYDSGGGATAIFVQN